MHNEIEENTFSKNTLIIYWRIHLHHKCKVEDIILRVLSVVLIRGTTGKK